MLHLGCYKVDISRTIVLKRRPCRLAGTALFVFPQQELYGRSDVAQLDVFGEHMPDKSLKRSDPFAFFRGVRAGGGGLRAGGDVVAV